MAEFQRANNLFLFILIATRTLSNSYFACGFGEIDALPFVLVNTKKLGMGAWLSWLCGTRVIVLAFVPPSLMDNLLQMQGFTVVQEWQLAKGSWCFPGYLRWESIYCDCVSHLHEKESKEGAQMDTCGGWRHLHNFRSGRGCRTEHIALLYGASTYSKYGKPYNCIVQCREEYD